MASLKTVFARLVAVVLPKRRFDGSADYWQRRYARGGGSGAGSHGRLAVFKAEVLNGFVAEHDIDGVIEFGCGDGSQLRLAAYPRYLGFGLSEDALARCRAAFAADPRFAFRALADDRGEGAALALSLDVIYHLVEDGVYEAYMARLFQGGERFVAIYSSNREDDAGDRPPHLVVSTFEADRVIRVPRAGRKQMWLAMKSILRKDYKKNPDKAVKGLKKLLSDFDALDDRERALRVQLETKRLRDKARRALQ